MRARVLALAAVCSVCSAQISFQGVVSGYVLDTRSNAIRPVLGIPGASYLGNGLSLPFGVTAAVARGKYDVAIMISDEQTRRAYVVHGLRSGGTAVSLDAAMLDSDRVYLSSDGSAAAIVSTERNEVQVVTSLASAPVVSGTVPLGPGGNITAVAISNSGCALVGAAGSDSGQLLRFCAEKPGLLVPMLDQGGFHPSALAWLNDQQAAVADAGSNQLWVLSLDGSAPRVLLDHSNGIESPVGVAVLNPNTIAVANAGGQALVVARADGAASPRTVSLPAAPTRLETLDTSSLLLSNTLFDFPLQLVDARQDFGVFFVPLN